LEERSDRDDCFQGGPRNIDGGPRKREPEENKERILNATLKARRDPPAKESRQPQVQPVKDMRLKKASDDQGSGEADDEGNF
jgi:hypothetical protein